MMKLVQFLAVVLLALAGVFGYFLHKSNWDFTLAKSMLAFEVKKLSGDAKKIESPIANVVAETDAPEEQAPEPTPAPTSSHTKDSIYKGSGNNFSDVKRKGGETEFKVNRINQN